MWQLPITAYLLRMTCINGDINISFNVLYMNEWNFHNKWGIFLCSINIFLVTTILSPPYSWSVTPYHGGESEALWGVGKICIFNSDVALLKVINSQIMDLCSIYASNNDKLVTRCKKAKDQGILMKATWAQICCMPLTLHLEALKGSS